MNNNTIVIPSHEGTIDIDYNAIINYESEGYSIYFECPVCSEIQKVRLADHTRPITLLTQKEYFANGSKYKCGNCRSELALIHFSSESTVRRSVWIIECIKRYSLFDWLVEGF